jgi:hypothetical protein
MLRTSPDRQNVRHNRTASLLTALYDRAQTTFTLAEAAEITGLRPALASSLLHKAGKRGLVSRLKRGLFILVPPELGSATEYSGNPYLVAHQLAGEAPNFISHASAMEIHRMVNGSVRLGHSRTSAGSSPIRNFWAASSPFAGPGSPCHSSCRACPRACASRKSRKPTGAFRTRLLPRSCGSLRKSWTRRMWLLDVNMPKQVHGEA